MIIFTKKSSKTTEKFSQECGHFWIKIICEQRHVLFNLYY